MSSENKPPKKKFSYTAERFQKAWDDFFSYIDNNPIQKAVVIKSGPSTGKLFYLPRQRPYTESGFNAFHGHGVNFLSQLNRALNSRKPTDIDYDEAMALACILSCARAKCYDNKYSGAAVGIFKSGIVARDLALMNKPIFENIAIGFKIIVTSKRGENKKVIN